MKIEGLPAISQLSKGDQILIATSEGIKTLSSEVLGNVFSDTSLFDNRTFSEVAEVNTQSISTHNKLRKWFAQDTSDEIYLIYSEGGNIKFVKETVVTDIETQEAVTIQATDLSGNKLYWNENPDDSKFSNGLPWVSDDEEERKVHVQYEESDYPVQVYQYNRTLIKSSEIIVNGSSVDVKDTYQTGTNSFGVIQKSDNSFKFQLMEGSTTKCGFELSKNDDGTFSAKLNGTWEGVNDWDLEDALLKPDFKEWFYNEQDIYTPINVLSVNTANKVKWFLNKNYNNQVYAVVEEGTVKIYYAQIKTSSGGSYTQKLVQNKFGQQLYWQVDVSAVRGTDEQGYPIVNGSRVYMVTEQTDYPVYIFDYDEKLLCSLENSTLSDNSEGVKLTFTGVNGRIGEIYRTNTELMMRYIDESGKVKSSISMGEESILTGEWKIGNDSIIELPTLPTDKTTEYHLVVKDGKKSWSSDTELPASPADSGKKVLTSNGGNLSWESETAELPTLPTDISERLLLSVNPDTKKLEWVTVSEILKSQEETEPEIDTEE